MDSAPGAPPTGTAEEGLLFPEVVQTSAPEARRESEVPNSGAAPEARPGKPPQALENMDSAPGWPWPAEASASLVGPIFPSQNAAKRPNIRATLNGVALLKGIVGAAVERKSRLSMSRGAF